MIDPTGRFLLSFNGEIYNFGSLRQELENLGHVFTSQTDTEVILEAYREWGKECLSRLNGMFAFALYDSTERKLLLARDRVGEKPLFYWRSGGMLAFASELKGLMKHPDLPRKLDLRAVDDFLAFGYVSSDRCIIQNVKKLPPAHAAMFDVETGVLNIWEYWRLPTRNGSVPLDAEHLEAELEGLLESSVRQQLVADVPVGILLSGGIDSSLVVAIASRVAGNRVKTFTVSFPGHGGHDESPHARLVARHFGTDHTELEAESANVDLLPILARQYDEPLGDSSMVPTYLVSRLIRRHATVALGGDGGDELFGGYRHYAWIQAQERIRRYVPAGLRRTMGSAAEQFLPLGFKGRIYMMSFGKGLARSIAHVNLFFEERVRRRLLIPRREGPFAHSDTPEEFKEGLCDGNETALRQATTVDFKSYLPDDILVKVDRASMLTSLEIRAPWLDRKVVEFAFGRVPEAFRASGGECKILPRRLAARLLPKGLDLRRKQGFVIPFKSWFRGNWGEFLSGILNDADPQLWNQRSIQSLVAGQRRGLGNSHRLFALTMFELWRREYKVTL
jgi:asparagine synthase (glutamine-hydrolysing)